MLRILFVIVFVLNTVHALEVYVKRVNQFIFIVNKKEFDIRNKKTIKFFHKELFLVKKKLLKYEKYPKKNFLHLIRNYDTYTAALLWSKHRKLRMEAYRYQKRHILLLENDSDYRDKKNKSYLVIQYSAISDMILSLNFYKKFDEALRYQKKAVKIIKKNPGYVDLFDEAFAYDIIASLYIEKYFREKNRKKGKLLNAKKFINEALYYGESAKNIYEVLLEKNDTRIATAYGKLAFINVKINTYESLLSAKEYKILAINIFNKHYSKKSKKMNSERKNLLNINKMIKYKKI